MAYYLVIKVKTDRYPIFKKYPLPMTPSKVGSWQYYQHLSFHILSSLPANLSPYGWELPTIRMQI